MLALAGKFLVSRNATFRRTGAGLEFATYNCRRYLDVPKFVASFIAWTCAFGFVIAALAGLVSPETMSTGMRAFLVFWALCWLAGGWFIGRKEFHNVFTRIEGTADDAGLRIVRKSPFGAASEQFPWADIEWITEFLTDGCFHKGICMIVKGRTIILDDYLEPEAAVEVAEALEKLREEAEGKAQRKGGRSSPCPPVN